MSSDSQDMDAPSSGAQGPASKSPKSFDTAGFPAIKMENQIHEADQRIQVEVEDAIKSAKSAAAAAGFDTDAMPAIKVAGSGQKEDADQIPAGKTSFVFDLEGLPSASNIGEVEDSVNALDGVDVEIVYPSARAWVTADRSVDPQKIVDAFAEQGVTAVLTDSSLRRRLAWADVENGRYTRFDRRRRRRSRAYNLPAHLRRRIDDDERAVEAAKHTGFFQEAPVETAEDESPTSVLFTARSMVTLTRFLISLLFSIPVLLISYYPNLQFDYWQLVIMGLSIPVVFYGAWPFHRALLGGLRRRMPALDGASSVAILLGWLWSVAMILFTGVGAKDYRANPQWLSLDPTQFQNGALFFDVVCGMTVLLLGGRLLSRGTNQSYLDSLAQYRPDPTMMVTVTSKNRSTGAVEKRQTAVQKLNVGDDVIVEPGSIIPVDGKVIGGSSTIDGHPLGIEPFVAKVNGKVYAGCINGEKALKVRVLHTGHRTWLAAIYRWVNRAGMYQNRADALATKAASVLVPISMVVALCDFALWALITNNLNQAFATALAVLACVGPVALAVSASLATRIGIESAASHGVLIKDGENIPELSNVNAALFNRVGTLSDGGMTVETVTADRGEDPELVLRVAGAVALESDHPLSRALVRAARESRDKSKKNTAQAWIDVSNFRFDCDGNFDATVEIPSTDSEGKVQTRTVDAKLWRPRNLSQLEGRLAAAAVSGGIPIVVRWKGKDRGVITLYDHVRSTATEVVEELESMGIETLMLSRDTYPVARRYGDSLGVTHVLAGVQPADKPRTVRMVRNHGTNVAMIGDTSVKECFQIANIGILVGAMKNIENPSILDHPRSDIVILEDKITPIPRLFSFGRKLSSLIRGNLYFAWGYNGVAMIAACAGILHPMFATVLMLGSSQFIEVRSKLAKRKL